MEQIPDAPWIRETEATGYCSSGWWNNPPNEYGWWNNTRDGYEPEPQIFAVYDPE